MRRNQKLSLRLVLTTTLTLALSPAFAGSWVHLSINSQTAHTSGGVFGGATFTGTSTANVNPPGMFAVFTADIIMGANLSGPSFGSGTRAHWHSASFLLKWKQASLGEAPPSTIYHHHLYDSSSSCSTESVYGQYKWLIMSAGVDYPGGGGILSNASGDGSSDFDSNRTKKSASWVPTWTVDSTDSNGLITYKCTSPTITGPTAKAATQVQLLNPADSAMSMGGSAVTDNFCFSESPTSPYP